MSYQVEISRKAKNILKKLPKKLRIELLTEIKKLEETPYPQGYKKLTGFKNLYRLRYQNWRIIYAIEKQRLIILVTKLGLRKDIYK
jgi:mRNA interferase RelE/StbE